MRTCRAGGVRSAQPASSVAARNFEGWLHPFRSLSIFSPHTPLSFYFFMPSTRCGWCFAEMVPSSLMVQSRPPPPCLVFSLSVVPPTKLTQQEKILTWRRCLWRKASRHDPRARATKICFLIVSLHFFLISSTPPVFPIGPPKFYSQEGFIQKEHRIYYDKTNEIPVRK
jgi:hypothetical protein